MKTLAVTLTLVVSLFLAIPASAVNFGFDCITSNSASNCSIGEDQLNVSVIGLGGGSVEFTFTNNVGSPSSVEGIYFEVDGISTSFISKINNPGTAFSSPASPGHLPGASPVIFTDFTFDADPPPVSNGINAAGESVIITLGISDFTFDQLINAMNNGLYQAGVHVIAFDNGGSESFVTGSRNDPQPPTTTPEPSTLMLFGIGLVGLGFLQRKK